MIIGLYILFTFCIVFFHILVEDLAFAGQGIANKKYYIDFWIKVI